jgi:hypothetical protein
MSRYNQQFGNNFSQNSVFPSVTPSILTVRNLSASHETSSLIGEGIHDFHLRASFKKRGTLSPTSTTTGQECRLGYVPIHWLISTKTQAKENRGRQVLLHCADL